VVRLTPGEKIEVTSDAVAGSLLRYAHSISVIVPLTVRLVTGARPRPFGPSSAPLYTAGNMTFAGVVSKFSPRRLVLHTRQGERTILIRQDTRYVEDGGAVEAAALQPNMRVFVRAGKDLYERIEAYQVIWGRIFDPKR
jgi:hypothetical protein